MGISAVLVRGAASAVLGLAMFGAIEARAAGLSPALEEVAQLVMRNSEAGKGILGEVTGLGAAGSSDIGFRSFLERMRWSTSEAFCEELSSELSVIAKELAEFRQGLGRQALPKEEREFAAKAARRLSDNERLKALMQESISLVNAAPAPVVTLEGVVRPGSASFITNVGNFRHHGLGEDVLLPRIEPVPAEFMAGGPFEPRVLRGGGWTRFWSQAGNLVGFTKALLFSEGQWISLFSKYGKRFTPQDYLAVTKYNRLMYGIDAYAETELMVRAYTAESRVEILRLNELTREATGRFVESTMNENAIAVYVSARKDAAAKAGLQITDLAWKAEERMLKTLARLRAVGGRDGGSVYEIGLIRETEVKVATYATEVKRLEAELAESRRLGLKLEASQEQADLARWKQLLDHEVERLEGFYKDFIESYSQVNLFANLRAGRLDGEVVAPFDMTDAFVFTQSQSDAWSELMDRALYNSTNELVLGQLKVFYGARTGQTRKIVRNFNKLYSSIAGKSWTDTDGGVRFKRFAQPLVLANLKLLGKTLGWTLPAAAYEEMTNQWISKTWEKIKKELSDEDGETDGDNAPPAHGSSAASIPGAPAAPRPYPGNPYSGPSQGPTSGGSATRNWGPPPAAGAGGAGGAGGR